MLPYASLLLACLIATAVAEEKYPPLHRLTCEEYEGTLRYWRHEHPKTFSFERKAFSGQNLPVYLLKITDSSVPDVDKQVCLITALHSGPERTGATGALALAEWLLTDEPVAVETRRKQIVLIMPIVNPLAMFHTDRFGNERHVDPYTGVGPGGKRWDIKSLSLLKPEDAPELAAVVSVIDQYQPEVHADLHGTGLQEYSPEQLGSRQTRQGQIMTEVTGSAYSNYALRPWDWRITEAMISAGRDAGYPSDRFEADAQRTLWGPDLAPLARKLWHGTPLFYSAHYAYAKYHTMILTQEVAWEQSVVARMRALFQVGNGVWMDEGTTGYPVNRMRHFVGHYVTGYGATARERRDSRVELWNKQGDFALGFLYPQVVGRESIVCAVNAEAKKAIAAEDLATLDANLKGLLAEKADRIEQFIAAGPEIKVVTDVPKLHLSKAESAKDVVVEHGIGFRLRLPYRKPTNIVVALNGEPLKQDRHDGFESWFADGFTQVQVNVPPARARQLGLFFVTCSYEPDEARKNGWMPPEPVQRQYATAKADRTPATFTDVSYGDHFRQTFDLWLAKSSRPTPLVLYIHGGGWAAHDKTDVHQHLDIRKLLDAGISVAAVNYRLLQHANAAGVKPPVEWPLHDAKRALQVLRSRSAEWNIDKGHVAATGVSAGGCSALWLALHDDAANAASSDPVERESTKVQFVAAKAPQPSLDPKELLEWIPNYYYGGHAFGFLPAASRADAFVPFVAARDEIVDQIRRFSPLSHLSREDPPLFVTYPRQEKVPVKGEPQQDPSHSAVLGLMLKASCDSLGVRCDLRYQNDGKDGDATLDTALLDALGRRAGE